MFSNGRLKQRSSNINLLMMEVVDTQALLVSNYGKQFTSWTALNGALCCSHN